MNSKVTITGMEVKTHVSSNLLVSLGAHDEDDEDEINANTEFKGALNSEVKGNLQPSSTIDAKQNHYYYTYDANDDGSKITDVNSVPYDHVVGNHINDDTTAGSQAYVDYVIQLKATNPGSTDLNVTLTKLNLLYEGGIGDSVTNAWRVALFSQMVYQGTDGNYYETAADALAKDSDKQVTTFGNFTTEEYVVAENITSDNYATKKANLFVKNSDEYVAAGDTFDNDTDYYVKEISNIDADAYFTTQGAALFDSKAVKGTKELAAVAIATSKWQKKVEKNSTAIIQVTLRLWLEGQDKDCNTTEFLPLTEDWELDFNFDFTSDAVAVEKINSVLNVDFKESTGETRTVKNYGDGSTVKLANGEFASSYQWYYLDPTAEEPKYTAKGTTESITMDKTGKYYVVVTTNKGNVYRSSVVDFIK